MESEEGDNSAEEIEAMPLSPSILQGLDEEQRTHIREV